MSVYRRFFEAELSATVIADIRAALNSGLALGNERFKTEVEALTGQPQTHRKRGPKARTGPGPTDRR
jgi:putative transposase